MNSKIIWISVIAVIASFFGGFYLANSLNGSELATLRAENERLKKNPNPAAPTDSDDSLSSEEISQKIAEADKNPGNIDYQRNLGLALLSYGVMKQNENLIADAARLLQRSYDSNPKDLDVTVALGTAFYDIASLKNDGESFKKSREFYARALEQKPDDASVRADFGSTFMFVNPPDFARAENELQKALQNDPKNERALLLMSQMLVKQNKPAEAEKFLVRLKEIDPKTPTVQELTAQMAQEDKTIQK